MPLEVDTEAQQLLRIEVAAGGDRARDEARARRPRRSSRGRARAGCGRSSRKLQPRGDASRAKARTPRWLSSASPPPSVASTSFQSSSAAAAQSKPEPRFAVVAGARTRIVVTRRRRSRPGRARPRSAPASAWSAASGSLSPCPVITHDGARPGRETRPREPGHAGRRGRLAEEPFVGRKPAPRVEDRGIVHRDELAARRAQGLVDLGRMGRLGDPDRRGGSVRARPPPAPARMRGIPASASANPSTYARVLPPPPYGSASTSGALPSSSTISNAAVFCPSIRCGLSEFTSAWVPRVASVLRRRGSASSNDPRTSSTRAPTARACASLPSATAPAGCRITAESPARAA